MEKLFEITSLFPEFGKLDKETLVVIGNGFDLASGIKSSYGDFDRWAAENGKRSKMMECFFGDIWRDVEKKLGEYSEYHIFELCAPEEEIDIDHVMRDAAANEDSVEYFFKQEIGAFVESFYEWVDSISLAGAKKIIDLSADSKYLTFNYTETLEELYGVPDEQILHIHGSRLANRDRTFRNNYYSHHDGVGEAFPNRDYIFGHNNYRVLNKSLKREWERNDKQLGWYTENPYEEIVRRMNALVKDTQGRIGRNRIFFDSLCDIKRVVVLGHSFSEIDWPYFDEIVRQTGKDKPWVISYYSEEDQQRINSFVEHAGLKNATPFDFEEVFQED